MQPESFEAATQLIIGVTNLAEQKILAYSQPTGITTILDNISGNVHLENDNRLYVSPAGNSSLIAINDNLSSNFNINLTSSYPLTGNMAKPVYRVSDDAGDFEAYYHRNVGLKRYELKDHLGNVRVLVSDALTAEGSDVSSITNDAEVLAQSDYYPFGMLQPGRNYNADRYRFGFNSKEMDNEISGTGNIYDYGFRIYNPRITKFLSVDPLFHSYPWYTPYQFAGNNPIWFRDLEGLEPAPSDANYAINIYLGSSLRSFLMQKEDPTNVNWIGFENYSIEKASRLVQNFRDIGKKPTNMFIEAHGFSGQLYLLSYSDKEPNILTGENVTSLERQIIDQYLTFKSLQTVKEKATYLVEQGLGDKKGNLWEGYKKQFSSIDALKSIMDNLEEGGNLIFGGCESGYGQWGTDLIEGLHELSRGRLNIYLSERPVRLPKEPDAMYWTELGKVNKWKKIDQERNIRTFKSIKFNKEGEPLDIK